ncbi:hypothetical protein VEE07_16440 [Escherichia coli]|nr:hypothetical protein VEE07_16440 [Escherichia coli]BEG29824.1 hypothetical protein VEF5_17200 [Escherichia coli]
MEVLALNDYRLTFLTLKNKEKKRSRTFDAYLLSSRKIEIKYKKARLYYITQ